MNDVFDPLNLDNRVSLNRTVLAGLPAIDPSVRGRMAWELIANVSMREAIAAEMPRLASTGEDPIVALDGAVATGDTDALRLAKRFGLHLAYMLATLMLDPGDEPYLRSYRAHWASLRHVYLGGGIVRGSLGRVMRDEAGGVLDGVGLPGVTLNVASHPSSLALLGAARSAPAGVVAALVCDFGGTNLKRGVATYEASALKTLRLLPEAPSLPVPEHPEDEDAAAAELGAYMTAAICHSLNETDGATTVIAAIARYVRDGHPIDYGSGGYGLLRRLSGNASAWLSREVSQRARREVSVTLSHDGTSAARTYAGEPGVAVVMMGTWMGSGYAPEDASGFRPLSPDFAVVI
jgi:hypothetical protein